MEGLILTLKLLWLRELSVLGFSICPSPIWTSDMGLGSYLEWISDWGIGLGLDNYPLQTYLFPVLIILFPVADLPGVTRDPDNHAIFAGDKTPEIEKYDLSHIIIN